MTNGHDSVFRASFATKKQCIPTELFLKSQDADEAIYYTVHEPAHERYNKLLRLHPEILKRAPLVYIASLLQMTPETLSRVRSSLL